MTWVFQQRSDTHQDGGPEDVDDEEDEYEEDEYEVDECSRKARWAETPAPQFYTTQE